MARLGLGSTWHCLFANDLCEKKAASYRRNFGEVPELAVKDIHDVSADEMPLGAVLSWASFPCQDLSLAGNRGGLRSERSGTFWPFWALMESLRSKERPVPIIVLENVVGALSSNDGRDFRRIVEVLASAGYAIGPLVIDAVHFVPQSRPRLFVIAVLNSVEVSTPLTQSGPTELWHPVMLQSAYRDLDPSLRERWVWWQLPLPKSRRKSLTDIIEIDPTGVQWNTQEETRYLLSLMSKLNRTKVRHAQALQSRIVGTVYRRTRFDDAGNKVQRAEVRFDQISGCLRTPAGGSSRQTILVVEGTQVRSRLLSPREAARLMGVRDDYKLPGNYNEAYHLMGDGIVVPVVSWLEQTLLRPLASRIFLAKAA
jgi:DNA (cytosine-5)-methyltransferase 1